MCDFKNLSDEELIAEFKNGSETAFEELYNRYASKIKRIIYYYIYNNDELEDVFHEVFIRVIKSLDTFKMDMSFSSWIYQIAVNCSKNYTLKKAKNIAFLENEKFRLCKKINLTPEDTLISEFDMEEFNKAVESLSDKYRDVFLLRFDQNLKYSEISSILKCSVRTAKWRMHKAIELISLYLKEKDVV